MLGFIKSICNELKLLSPITILYYAYIRSILEYEAIIWDPFTSCGSDQIERIKRKFLNYRYYPIMNKLDLISLVDIRKAANLNFLR